MVKVTNDFHLAKANNLIISCLAQFLNHSVHFCCSSKLFPPAHLLLSFLKPASFRPSPGSLSHFNRICAQRSHPDILVENNIHHHPLCHLQPSLLKFCIYLQTSLCMISSRLQELRDFVGLVPSISPAPRTQSAFNE